MPQTDYNRYRPKRRQRSKHSLLIIILIIGSVAMLRLLSMQAQADIAETEARALKADITEPMHSARRLDVKQLNTEINQLIKAESGARIGVQLHDFVLDRTFSYGSDDSFVAASVPKLLTASLWFHDIDEGRRKLSDPVAGSTAGEQLRLLIEISDNNAWEVLDAKLGQSALEAYAKSIGMQRYDFDDNSIAPSDVLILLQKLYQGDLLKADSQQKLLGFMERANYKQYIVAALPDSADVYHKVGFLEDRVLDTAIVKNNQLTYVLVIFAEAKNGNFSLASAGQTVRDITEAVQSRYQK